MFVARGLRFLSAVYFLAGLVVLAEVLGYWGDFASSSEIARTWKIYFSVCNLVAASVLLFRVRMSQLVFVVILLAQLAVYVLWSDQLEYQAGTLAFYFLTLVFYFVLLNRRFQSRQVSNQT